MQKHQYDHQTGYNPNNHYVKTQSFASQQRNRETAQPFKHTFIIAIDLAQNIAPLHCTTVP